MTENVKNDKNEMGKLLKEREALLSALSDVQSSNGSISNSTNNESIFNFETSSISGNIVKNELSLFKQKKKSSNSSSNFFMEGWYFL